MRGLAQALALGLWLNAGPASACTVDPAGQTAYPDSVTTDLATRGPVSRAWFDDPVSRYRHFVLGRQHEPETLWVDAMGQAGLCGHALTLDDAHVFEDTAPRLVDLDGDGTNEVIVVRSHVDRGAQVAVYRWTGTDLVLDATTPYIGRPHRWLAIVGVADLDGDGAMEIAFVDRPHLARTLRIWRYAQHGLTEIATVAGLTNHRLGAATILSGIRDCDGSGPEILTADSTWSRLMVTRLRDGRAQTHQRAPWSGQALTEALACRL